MLIALLAVPCSAQGILAEIEAVGAIDSLYAPHLEAIANDVAPVISGVGSITVNSPPAEDGIAVYIVDVDAARGSDRLAKDSRVASARDGAAAIPEERAVLFGANALRRLATVSQLKQIGYSSTEAALITLARPLDDLRDLWSPQANPALARDDGYVGTYEVFSGMVAFLMAHEIYHVLQPPRPLESLPEDAALWGRAAQLAWGCDTLVSGVALHNRNYEAAADAFAVDVLALIPDPAGGAAQRLKYEFGTYLLGLHLTTETLVDFAARTDAPLIRASVKSDIRPEIAGLLDRLEGQYVAREELVPTLFSASHPSIMDRLFAVSTALRSRPGSAFYGEGDGTDTDAMMWGILRQKMCDEAEAARDRP